MTSTLTWRDSNIAYRANGQGTRGIVFLHGLGGDHAVWSSIADHFGKKYRTFALDLAGHGASDARVEPKDFFEGFPTLVEALLQKEGLGEVILVAHSISGNLLKRCLDVKFAHIIGAVFVDCTFNSSQRIVAARNQMAAHLDAGYRSRGVPALKDWYQSMMPGESVDLVGQISQSLDLVSVPWMMGLLESTNFIQQETLTSVPTLILESTQLTALEPERSFSFAISHAEKEVWQTRNHFFFWFEHKRFCQRIEEFLQGQCRVNLQPR